MICEKCGWNDLGTGDTEHACSAQAAYVPVIERNHLPTAQDEMHRLFDECARLGTENAALRALLLEWYALFAPVRREDTVGARLLGRTAKALSSEFRYKTPNAEVSGAGTASAGLPG